MRKLSARGLLKSIAYDMNIALDNGVECKKLLEVTKKRLENIKDTKYYIIDWS